MLRGAHIAVVVPAHDEERWIAEVVRTLPAFVDTAVVVDDASGDATAEIARDAGALVIEHPTNRGVGAAIVTGYRVARSRGADVVAVMAGDGQMDPRDLEAVVAPVVDGAADYVKGNRFAHPEVAARMPAHRLHAGRALAWLTGRAAGLDDLHDSQCGYTAIAGHALDTLDLGALWPGYGYCNDLLGALARRRLRVREVVVRPVYRGEASGLRPWHLGTIGFLIARAAWRRFGGAAR
jgi:glycosyltransferase involved in cell wall biosynthesis